jgi:ribosomal protein S18 acetylase RimI-like enzyme
MNSETRLGELVVSLRPIEERDMEFLYNVFSATREDVARMPWSDEEKVAFCRHQFQAQHVHYQRFFAGSDFDVVLLNKEPVGRVYVHRDEEEYRVIDLAFLPQFRGRGIGSLVIMQILDEADQQHKPVRLRVDPNRRARKWYESLGFRKIAVEESGWHMERAAH